MHKYTNVLGLFLVLVMTYLIYWQGITGIFLLDDYGVLQNLGKYAYLDTWRSFFLYMLEGHTGPTGRPVSLATFFLTAQTWPASPYFFKLTNIVIHLINGLLIYFLLIRINQLINTNSKKAAWLALATTALWLLHPIQITSVLYIVQRMTELSTLFILLGLISYLSGRSRLVKTTDLKSYVLITLSVFIFGILSVLSKESGALLLIYIVVIEFFLLRPFNVPVPTKFNHWLLTIALVPFLLLIVYLASTVFNQNVYFHRSFTLEERLLSQSRILFDYLVNILIPGLQTPTLFHDDYKVSKGLLDPWTTLPSILGIGILIISALWYRKTLPVLSFAIAWFFCGHILESTFIPLELYFEHRNYLPSLGPLLALVYFAASTIEHLPKIRKAVIASFAVFSLLIVGSTLNNTILWGKPIELIVGWAQEHPKSTRAIEILEALELEMGFKINDKKLKASIEEGRKGVSNSSYVLLRELKFSCFQGELTTEKLQHISGKLQYSTYDMSTANAFNSFASDWMSGRCSNISSQNIIEFTKALLKVKNLQHDLLPHTAHYNLSRFWEVEKNFGRTMEHLQKAYHLKPELGGLLLQAKHFSSAGYYDEAIRTLNDTSLLETSLRKKIILILRQEEIDQLVVGIKQAQTIAQVQHIQ